MPCGSLLKYNLFLEELQNKTETEIPNFSWCKKKVKGVFLLVDNLMPSRIQIFHWPSYKLKPFANSNREHPGQRTLMRTLPMCLP